MCASWWCDLPGGLRRVLPLACANPLADPRRRDEPRENRPGKANSLRDHRAALSRAPLVWKARKVHPEVGWLLPGGGAGPRAALLAPCGGGSQLALSLFWIQPLAAGGYSSGGLGEKWTFLGSAPIAPPPSLFELPSVSWNSCADIASERPFCGSCASQR